MACNKSKNPVGAYARACNKVGALATRRPGKGYSHLAYALNEQRHMLLELKMIERAESSTGKQANAADMRNVIRHSRARDQALIHFDRCQARG